LNGNRLQLTDTSTNFEDASAFWNQKVGVSAFTNDFSFQITNPGADGFAFVIQGNTPTALGGSGGALGYGSGSLAAIPNSVAVKFDLYNNSGEGTNSTGLYVNGAAPILPAVTLGGGVSLQSGDPLAVHMTYDGTTLTMLITDMNNPAATFTTSWKIDIPGTVGSTNAYAGFTGATGGLTANQQILTWSFTSGAPPMVYQTTSLLATAVTSGPSIQTFAYANFPTGSGTMFNSTNVGDNVTFTVNVPKAGTYDVSVSYKEYAPRAIMQTSINGTNIGPQIDEYIGVADAYVVTDLGSFNFAKAGNYNFKFTVAGKNPNSDGYSLTLGAITLK
jgi:hypothetical protein